jgi:hypothetical protein
VKLQEGDTFRMSAGELLRRILGYKRGDKTGTRAKLRKEELRNTYRPVQLISA